MDPSLKAFFRENEQIETMRNVGQKYSRLKTM